MGSIVCSEKKIVFEGIINESEVAPLREFLNSNAPETIEFDFLACKDMHTAIIQVLLAYRHLYSAEYVFSEDNDTYRKTLEGFFLSDNDTN